MSLSPILFWPLLGLVAALGYLLIWLPAGARERTEPWVTRGRRTAMVTLMLVAGLRPGTAGGDVTVHATDLDVFFVIDTTTSVVAEDYGDKRPRLEGVRTDVKAIARELPGARFSILTFDHQSVTRLPLTTDGTALDSAIDTLLPETSAWSRGSSVTIADAMLRKVLASAAAARPEQARVVFYLGDGEQTSGETPAQFTIDPALINGGSVLGYGTAEGGPMKATALRETSPRKYVTDPATGQQALSKIDEAMLTDIATQLKVPYHHRAAGQPVSQVFEGVKLKELNSLSSAQVGANAPGRTELYWIFLLLAAALAAWELGLAGVALWETRVRLARRTKARAS